MFNRLGTNRRITFILLVVGGVAMTPAFSGDGQARLSKQPPALTYNIIDLGTLGGPTSTALGINDQGQVVGSADTAQGLRHAYMWDDGVMTDLGTLGFPTAQSEAWDINNDGVVVGNVGTGNPNRAFIWENGIQTEIGPPQILKSALGINDAKQVVGIHVVAPIGDHHAFLWQNGALTDLGTLGGTYSVAWDINESGQIAGGSSTGGEPGGAFLWQDGLMSNLGTLGGNGSGAVDLNEAGIVVGESQRTTEKNALTHAFSWNGNQMTDLGALGGFNSSRAKAINNDGVVVGIGTGGAFHYDSQLGFRFLQALIPSESGWTGLRPEDINNLGWIVGYGTGPDGPNRAFVMVPATVIPTISEYGVLVTILLLLASGTLLLRSRPVR